MCCVVLLSCRVVIPSCVVSCRVVLCLLYYSSLFSLRFLSFISLCCFVACLFLSSFLWSMISVFLCLVFVYVLLSFLPCLHARRKIRRSAAMYVADVASLDATVLAWDRWMGCILCPYPAGAEEKVNLLEKGEAVRFYKRKKAGEEARYSRQVTEGICLPTDINACPERWRVVSAHIALWAWDGRSIIRVKVTKVMSEYRCYGLMTQ
jgi:hypothetical protein